MVGAPSYPTGTDRHGAVYIFYNSGSEIEENHDSIVTNASAAPANDYLGLYLARGVDLGYATDGKANNDNRSDIFIGALAYGTGSAHSFL